MQKKTGRAGIKRTFRGKFYSHPEGLVSCPNHRMKADSSFAAIGMRAAGWQSFRQLEGSEPESP